MARPAHIGDVLRWRAGQTDIGRRATTATAVDRATAALGELPGYPEDGLPAACLHIIGTTITYAAGTPGAAQWIRDRRDDLLRRLRQVLPGPHPTEVAVRVSEPPPIARRSGAAAPRRDQR